MSVIQFSFWKYNLIPKTRIGAVSASKEREGALLCIRWPDDATGYADLFPWKEFGDESLDQQLFALNDGRITRSMEQTIWLARRDGVARRYKQNLLKGLPRVRNHFLINDPDQVSDAEFADVKKLGYQTVKLKCGKNIAKEMELAVHLIKQRGFILRLDFNSRATPAEFHDIFSKMPAQIRQKIEFVEDPFPFEHGLWKNAAALVNLAIDQEYHRVPWETYSDAALPPFKVIVLKPARQDVVKATELAHRFRLKMAVTSSLDHPLGIMHAAALCGEYKKLYPNMILDSGCFSHRSYEPDPFSQQLPVKGPFLPEVAGTGVGFDDILKTLPWTKLKDLQA